MMRDYIEGLVVVIVAIAASCLITLATITLIRIANDTSTENEIETTTAKPIYQQPIGDEAEPDILIIYEAEVDGVKVYPSVIKEAK